ncbi:MAG: hypothetical protein HC837_10490 [Chloroflexaceae bacterium]|nr:hypothetical protein [Chloroflexaceae bacterium]
MLLGLAVSAGLVIGPFALVFAPAVSNWSVYRLYVLFLGLFIGVVGILSGNLRRMLLLCLVFVVPLVNIAFAPFDKSIPHHSGGAQAGIILFLHDFPFMVLIVFGIVDLFIRRTSILFSIIDLMALSLIGWSIITIYHSQDVVLSIAEIIRISKFYLLSRVIAGNVTTKLDVLLVFCALLAGLVFQSLVGSLQYVGIDVMGLGDTAYGGGDTPEDTVTRIVGTFGWPNTIGAYLAAIITIGMIIWFCNALGKWSNFIFVLSAFGILPLILTFSRGSWVAMAGGVAAGLFMAYLRGWIRINIVPKLVVMGFAAIMVALAFADSILARFSENTIDVRFQLNDVAMNMVHANPFLGVGINTFTVVMRDYDPNGVWFHFFEPVHNAFLLIAAETGLIGISVFMLLLFTAMWEGFQAARIDDRFLSAFAIGLVAALVSIAYSNIGDVHLKTEGIFVFFWMFIGLIVAIRRMQLAELAARFPVVVPAGRLKRNHIVVQQR